MSVIIRMYNAGFGDCFLLTFPAPGRPRKVLIDCGRHTLSGGTPKLSRVVDQILADVLESGGPRIDIVVATHRHQDHVEGFGYDGWDKVTVDEVWMPWTEDPTDPVARNICDRQSAKAQHLLLGISAMTMADEEERAYLLGYAGNNLTNAAAMRLLHEGFLGTPVRRFLPESDPTPSRFTTAALPGVEVYVLGPSRDPDVMKEMDPPAGESYLKAVRAAGATDAPAPFDVRWSLTRAQYEQRAGEPLEEDLPVASEPYIGEQVDDALLEASASLEKAVNSTSLVLLFHIGQAWLLFPGDAQWGTWNAILNHPVYAPLLKRLTFYKVGHHGSHNATPVSFVEHYITDKVRAMIPYGFVKKWPEIPKQGLLDQFALKQTVFARTDQPPGAPFAVQMEGVDVLYIDYEAPV